MSVLDGFTVFDFEEGAPYMSVTKNGVTFNKGVVKKLGFPRYVQLLISESDHKIAIRPCDESTPKCTSFYKESNSARAISVRWNARDLLSTISSINNWNLEKESYRINGFMYKEENVMVFNLDDASLLK